MVSQAEQRAHQLREPRSPPIKPSRWRMYGNLLLSKPCNILLNINASCGMWPSRQDVGLWVGCAAAQRKIQLLVYHWKVQFESRKEKQMEQEVNLPVRKNIQSHSVLLAPIPHDVCQCFDFLDVNKSHSLIYLHVFLRFFSPLTFPVLQDNTLVHFIFQYMYFYINTYINLYIK